MTNSQGLKYYFCILYDGNSCEKSFPKLLTTNLDFLKYTKAKKKKSKVPFERHTLCMDVNWSRVRKSHL